MRIGVIGSGDVGKSLARGFKRRGDEVMIGSRTPAKLEGFAKQHGTKAGNFADTAKFGEMIALGTLGTATEEALQLAGSENFADKIVIDATNPLRFAPGVAPMLAISGDDSLGERVQAWLPSARVVKAFNTVGNALFVNPQLAGGPPDMFICGNDAAAKATVTDLCHQWGWGVIDIGPISGSRYLEAMCMTWVLHGVLSSSWTHAFKMLHK
jgi:predicted dinucleotide-binding enzyme